MEECSSPSIHVWEIDLFLQSSSTLIRHWRSQCNLGRRHHNVRNAHVIRRKMSATRSHRHQVLSCPFVQKINASELSLRLTALTLACAGFSGLDGERNHRNLGGNREYGVKRKGHHVPSMRLLGYINPCENFLPFMAAAIMHKST